MLWFTVAAQALAQAPSPAAPQKILKVRTELVTVPVVVTDRSGAHMHGLKKEDFVLSEDGKEQAVASFEEIREPKIPPSISHRPNQFSNVLVQGEAPLPLTILVFDLVNTPSLEQAYAKQQILKFLGDSRSRNQLMSLFVISRDGVKVLHDFTTDMSALAASLGGVRREGQLVEQASQKEIPRDAPAIMFRMKREIEQEQRMESLERRVAITITLQSLQQIAHSCAGLPGRKALLWASSGFPFSVNELSQVINIAGVKGDSVGDVYDLYQKTWRLLNQAQVALYPVDVRGLANSTLPDMTIGKPNAEFSDHATWMQIETIDTFRAFAQATGGRAFFNTNDLQAAFQSASNDNASYYLLSYYLVQRDKKPGWHKLGVKVHRDGVEVRARNGFFLEQGAKTDASELQVALDSPLAYTAIPITGEWQQVTPAPGHKKKVTFQLTMPANFAEIDEASGNHMLLQFVAVARTPAGEKAADTSKTMDGHLKPDSLAQVRTHGMDYRGALTLDPGEYTVHFAVQDRLSGRVGSVAAPLRVEP
jgi:VWFA-related protein